MLRRVAARFTRQTAPQVRTANLDAVRALTPRYRHELERAVSSERDPKVRATLLDALDHFEQVVDGLKAAEHEIEEGMRERPRIA